MSDPLISATVSVLLLTIPIIIAIILCVRVARTTTTPDNLIIKWDVDSGWGYEYRTPNGDLYTRYGYTTQQQARTAASIMNRAITQGNKP